MILIVSISCVYNFFSGNKRQTYRNLAYPDFFEANLALVCLQAGAR